MSFGNVAYTYSSLSGNQFTMYDDRSMPMKNSAKVNYTPSMAHDSRYIQSAWDSGVVRISAAVMRKTLDFMKAMK